jgi:hypothetical protein
MRTSRIAPRTASSSYGCARGQVAIEHERDLRLDAHDRAAHDAVRPIGFADRRREDRRDDHAIRRRQRTFPSADGFAEQVGDAMLDRQRGVDVLRAAGIGQQRAGHAGMAGGDEMLGGAVHAFGSRCHVG